ncbi:carbonic anhydrase [Balneolales bacterium ANBcel1]|nr:carbonic anhydrase [Balneolales bacterium ANBcel1]
MTKSEILSGLHQANAEWSKNKTAEDPVFFKRHLAGQQPEYLWIGCADSRVPVREMTQSGPGEVFAHLNIANLVHNHDMSFLSVLQYAVDVLKVKKIVVCGHHSCGGVKASMEQADYGLVGHWIRPVKQVYEDHREEIDALPEEERADRLSEWNAREQAANVARTSIVQNAWKRNQELSVHGVVYRMKDGKLLDLDCHIRKPEDLPAIYHIR